MKITVNFDNTSASPVAQAPKSFNVALEFDGSALAKQMDPDVRQKHIDITLDTMWKIGENEILQNYFTACVSCIFVGILRGWREVEKEASTQPMWKKLFAKFSAVVAYGYGSMLDAVLPKKKEAKTCDCDCDSSCNGEERQHGTVMHIFEDESMKILHNDGKGVSMHSGVIKQLRDIGVNVQEGDHIHWNYDEQHLPAKVRVTNMQPTA